MRKKRIQPGEKVSLKLTATERKLILQDLMCLDRNSEQIVRSTPTGKPVMMTLNDLDELGGYITAEANHCDDQRKQNILDAIFEKIQRILETYTDEEPPQTIKIEDARKEKVISDQAVQIAEWAAQALVAAEQLRIKTKPLDNFWLAPAQRDVLLLVPGLSKTVKNKLAKDSSSFTVAEVAGVIMTLAEDFLDGDSRQQVVVLLVAGHLMDRLQERIAAAAQPAASKRKPKDKATVAMLIQFKITLIYSQPEIWRRIQVQDCTLDKLHEHIQTAMGWTNSHLHEFEIKSERYGDPALWAGGFEDYDGLDSTETMVSDILPKNGKRFACKYQYDFGDSWEHEILFEGYPPIEKGKKYPICLEGERACPPEDIGGIWGFETFLEALADPKHEEHEMYAEWGADFDPHEFDAAKTTKAMRRGLPDWRQS